MIKLLLILILNPNKIFKSRSTYIVDLRALHLLLYLTNYLLDLLNPIYLQRCRCDEMLDFLLFRKIDIFNLPEDKMILSFVTVSGNDTSELKTSHDCLEIRV